MEYANQALREMNLQQRKRKKHNKGIQQEINVLLIMFKIIYDTANFIHFHKINTREWCLMRENVLFFNLSWN